MLNWWSCPFCLLPKNRLSFSGDSQVAFQENKPKKKTNPGARRRGNEAGKIELTNFQINNN
jgi:hypothetical protein